MAPGAERRKNGANVVAIVQDYGFPGGEDMWIKGSLFQNQTNLISNPAKKEFVIRTDSQVIAVIDEDGNLRLRGQLYDTLNPHLGQ